MTASDLLLWRPAPTTNVLREAVAACSRFTVVDEMAVDEATGDEVVGAHAGRPVLLLPSARHQVEQVYREHVLAGGTDTFDRFRARRGLDDAVGSWRETMRHLVDEVGGSTVVTTDDTDESVQALADAAAVDVDELRSLAPAPSGISARGLEVLRRMNTFTHDAAEQRRARRFCTSTFAAADPGELDVPDAPWPTP